MMKLNKIKDSISKSKRFELSFAHFVKIYKKLPRTLFVSSLPLSKFIETRAGWRWSLALVQTMCVEVFANKLENFASLLLVWCWPVAGSEHGAVRSGAAVTGFTCEQLGGSYSTAHRSTPTLSLK